MNPTLKAILINIAKNAVNAAILSLAPVYHDPMAYNLHTAAGMRGVGELIGIAVLTREGLVYIPKLLAWSNTGDGGQQK